MYVCVHMCIIQTCMFIFLHSPTHPHTHAQCDPSEATWQLINSIVLQETDPRIMFLGGGCSLATEPLAALAGRFYQIPIVSLHVIVLVYTCNKCMVHVMCQISHTCVHYTFNQCILKQKVEKMFCKCTHTHSCRTEPPHPLYHNVRCSPPFSVPSHQRHNPTVLGLLS